MNNQQSEKINVKNLLNNMLDTSNLQLNVDELTIDNFDFTNVRITELGKINLLIKNNKLKGNHTNETNALKIIVKLKTILTEKLAIDFDNVDSVRKQYLIDFYKSNQIQESIANSSISDLQYVLSKFDPDSERIKKQLEYLEKNSNLTSYLLLSQQKIVNLDELCSKLLKNNTNTNQVYIFNELKKSLNLYNTDLISSTPLENFKAILHDNKNLLGSKICKDFEDILKSIDLNNLLNDDLMVVAKETTKYNQPHTTFPLSDLNTKIKNSDVLQIYSKIVELNQEITRLENSEHYMDYEKVITEQLILNYKNSITILQNILMNYQKRVNALLLEHKIQYNLKSPGYIYILSQIPDNDISLIYNRKESIESQDIKIDDRPLTNYNNKNIHTINDNKILMIAKLYNLCDKFTDDPEIGKNITALKESLFMRDDQNDSTFDPVYNFQQKYDEHKDTFKQNECGSIFSKLVELIFGDYFKTPQEKFVKQYKEIIAQNQDENNQSINNQSIKL